MQKYLTHFTVLIAAVFLTAPCTSALGWDDAAPTEKLDRKEVQRHIKSLGTEKFAEREEAQRRLVEMGLPVLPVLRGALADFDPEIRTRAKDCITQIERNRDIAALIGQLKSKSAKERLEAVDRLSGLGPHAGPAIKALIEVLDDPDSKVRERAIYSFYGP